jgi:hypothetical protein
MVVMEHDKRPRRSRSFPGEYKAHMVELCRTGRARLEQLPVN